jgi:PAS domain S-box-containing protein
MAATLSKLVTPVSSIAHQLAARVRAVARIASRERPADPDVARLFEFPFDLMGIASLDGTMLRVTPGFERVLGLAPEEVVGRRLVEIVHPDDREATAAVFAGVLESGELSVFENRLPAADGSHRWLQWNLLADADGGSSTESHAT